MNNIENIMFEGKNINLSLLSNEQLQELLEKVNKSEFAVKQELGEILQNLA